MTPKRTVVASAAAGLAVVLTAGGCQLFFPTDLPTPGPTQTAASQPGESKQERTIRLDTAAAISAYEVANAEQLRLARAGGANKPTRKLKQNASGDYLSIQMYGLRYFKERRAHVEGPFTSSIKAGGGWSPTEIGLIACEDSSKARIVNREGVEIMKKRATRFVQTLTAKKIDGRWKIDGIDTKIVKSFKNESGCDSP